MQLYTKNMLRIYGAIVFLLLIILGCSREQKNVDGGKLGDFVPRQENLNVLIVSFDALRADALGVYGNKRNTSPNIDEFSDGALVFDQAHSVSQSTPTSFASAFLGNLPHRAFVGWKMVKGKTIAQVFKFAGYHTTFITVNAQLNKERFFNQGFDFFHLLESSRDEDMLPEALDRIDEIKKDKFFAWLHFLSPHAPYDLRDQAKSFYSPPADYKGKYKSSAPIKYVLDENEDIEHIRNLYLSEVIYADFIFKKILEKIESIGLHEKTIIILTSDHGEEFMEHGGIEHNNLFEEVIKIPFILKHPYSLKSGRTNLPYINIDLLPTLASMLKIPVAQEFEGIDLYDFSPENARKTVAVAMTNDKKVEVSLMQQKKKLIHSCTPEKKNSFFDLYSDPAEKKDQFYENLNFAQGLLDALSIIVGKNACDAIMDANRGVLPEQGLSKHQIKKLKSLGYLK